MNKYYNIIINYFRANVGVIILRESFVRTSKRFGRRKTVGRVGSFRKGRRKLSRKKIKNDDVKVRRIIREYYILISHFIIIYYIYNNNLLFIFLFITARDRIFDAKVLPTMRACSFRGGFYE